MIDSHIVIGLISSIMFRGHVTQYQHHVVLARTSAVLRYSRIVIQISRIVISACLLPLLLRMLT